ncbi:MAG: ATP synthase F1 subunit epsilon [Ruminococcus sp.]
MNTFHLEILSPERVFYTGECVSIVIPISDGMLGIMANHSPLSAAIPDGELSFTKPSGEKVICAVSNGIADVTDNRVRVLCETALSPDEIDADKERRDAEKATDEIKKKQSKVDYKLWQLSFNRSINRLKVKKNKINF